MNANRLPALSSFHGAIFLDKKSCWSWQDPCLCNNRCAAFIVFVVCFASKYLNMHFSLFLRRTLYSSEITGYSEWRELCLSNSSWLLHQYNLTRQLSQCITFLKHECYLSEGLRRCLAWLPVWITRSRPLQDWLAQSRILFGQIQLTFCKTKDQRSNGQNCGSHPSTYEMQSR